mmetsp:Transcript_16373/g.32944  ORF Transcript_16373/g.32944 Transcript_16373/m.32944 type:complete len:1012 (-) Transcript_16373:229-3264(-)
MKPLTIAQTAWCMYSIVFRVNAFTATFPNVLSVTSTVTRYSTILPAETNLFFADAITDNAPSISNTESTPKASTNQNDVSQKSRTLGSQENLMLPRQYGPKLAKGESPFPSMAHVSAYILSSTPSVEALSQAIEIAMDTHPLLRCHVEGDGEPDERIDIMQMVRKGDPNPCRFVSPAVRTFSSQDVLRVVDVSGNDAEALEKSWKTNFISDLDDGSWYEKCSTGPLWKLTLHRPGKEGPCALVFSSNHAISDQGSVNVLVNQILADVNAIEESGSVKNKAKQQEMPVAVEDSVLGLNNRWTDVQTGGISLGTIKYVLDKAGEGFRSPVILPDSEGSGNIILGAITTIMGKSAGGESEGSLERKSTLQFRSLSKETTTAFLEACRANGVTVTNALIAAMALTSSDFIDGGDDKPGKSRNYKILQSLDMRRFGAQLDKCDTVACMAGSNDLMFGPLEDRSGKSFRSSPESSDSQKLFWDLAREARDQTKRFFESNGPVQAVRVFDFAMSISDMNNLVDLTAKSKDSQGRAYSAGISNNGVYERQKAVRRESSEDRESIAVKHGKYEVKDIYYGTPHSRSGCLYQASTITVDGSMKLTFHPASPIVSEDANAEFADAFVEVLEKIASTKVLSLSEKGNFLSKLNIPEGTLTLAAAGLGLVSVATHAGAWSEFFNNLATMQANVADPKDFWDAFNFWIFFAVGHPLLQPILWISDVLHGSPGPLVFDLVPASFLMANILFVGATALSKDFRNALNVAALSAFLTYVGAGLDGQAGLGDFNLQMNDSYNGQIVKGCPAYEDVRQPSMDGFDLEKYQGKWYEQKFHDWTQFKEVYDTTLDIKLTSDKKGWVDDFGVAGPAPDSAKLSWDKSPVANGAHYFMFGRVDENDPPGILREKGFGVEFPNYIVDVKKDPQTGEYTEAIQFQCLERGGVRVFEGINFMSRNPIMTDEEMRAMHQRAKNAGMYPYGASEDQMHTVARRGVEDPKIDNNWQQMWHAIGVDKLLELLAESIEDGGR